MKKRIRVLMGLVVSACMFILLCPLTVMAEGTRTIDVASFEAHGQIEYSTNEGDQGTITSSMTSFEISSDASTLTISITPDEGYQVDPQSSIVIDGNAGSTVNTENKIVYSELKDAGAGKAIQVNVRFQTAGNPGDPGNPGAPQERPLYLTWDGGSETITINSASNPNNLFVLNTGNMVIDMDTIKVYPEATNQISGTTDLMLNKTSTANDTTDTIRVWQVVDFPAPNKDDGDPNNDHPATTSGVNAEITLMIKSVSPVALMLPEGTKIPDGWGFGNRQLADLSTATTIDTAATLEAYYENAKIILRDPFGDGYSKIVAIGIPDEAVTIGGDGTDANPFMITFNSDFFDTVTFEVTLADGSVRYLTIVRRGIEIHLYSNDKIETLHGTQRGASINWADGETEKIIATFYYDANKSCTDYQMVANITYADGKVETKVVSSATGKEVLCGDSKTKGGDYVVWSGTANNRPASVAVTAVVKGAFDENATTFAGAKFGSGSGVTWVLGK